MPAVEDRILRRSPLLASPWCTHPTQSPPHECGQDWSWQSAPAITWSISSLWVNKEWSYRSWIWSNQGEPFKKRWYLREPFCWPWRMSHYKFYQHKGMNSINNHISLEEEIPRPQMKLQLWLTPWLSRKYSNVVFGLWTHRHWYNKWRLF